MRKWSKWTRGAGMWPSMGAGLCVLMWLGLAGCGEQGATESTLPDATGRFDRPQAVLARPEAVYVANTAFNAETLAFGDGFVAVVDPSGARADRRWWPSEPNPQALAEYGGGIWVLASGRTRFLPEKGTNVADGPGVLERFEVDAPDGAAPTLSLALEVPTGAGGDTIGGFGTLAIDPETGRAWAGSGLSSHVLKFDLAAGAILRGTDNPIRIGDPATDAATATLVGNDTVVVRWHPDGFVLAVSFNTNRLFRIDPDSDEILGGAGADLAATSLLEGPLDIAVVPGHQPDVYVLLTLANAVSTWASGSGAVNPRAWTTDSVSNALLAHGDALWVLSSGSNNVRGIALDDGSPRGTFVFPAGSNPWAMSALGNSMWVSLNLVDGLARVRIDDREVVEILR